MKKHGFFCFILTLLLLSTCSLYAQEYRTEKCVYFRVNRTEIDSAYMGNAARIKDILSTLRIISKDSSLRITEIFFCGTASPEGSYELNRRLARERLSSLERLVRKEIDIPDSIVKRDDSYIPWDYLKSQVRQSNLERRDSILAIIGEQPELVRYNNSDRLVDHRIVKLQQLDNRRVWNQLQSMFFSHMRNAYVVLVTCRSKRVIPPGPELELGRLNPLETELSMPRIENINLYTPVPQTRFFALKTNLLFDVALCANLGFELELWPKWSLDIPVWYSPYDITATRKVRLLAIQPEIRRWLKKAGEGHFFGLHTHVVGFNIAINDHGRYQDPNHALWGLGLSYGFAMHLDKAKHWGLEFNIGAGFAEYDYDVYENRKDGALLRSGSALYWGITRAGITLSYKWYRERKNRRWMKW